MKKITNLKRKKNPSQGEKEILLKVVVLSMPTYAMSCFKLSGSFCDKIKGLMLRFWWRQKENEKRIHWFYWKKKLCEPKSHSGMGFKSLKNFNTAILAKQWWKILQNDKNLLHQLYKAGYFPHGHIFDAKLGTNSSWGREQKL